MLTKKMFMKNSHLITSFKTLLQSRTLVHSIFLAFVVLLFFSCKRETGITQEKEHIKIFEAAQSWLKKKATASTIEAREQIQKLINNLDKNSISYTKSTSDSYFSAIRINQKQVDNDTESYFVLKMKKTGEIEWTIIVEKNSTAECNNPSKTLAAFLLMNNPPDGRYTLRSTLGTFMHEVTYKNQAIQTIKTLKKKPKTNSRTEEYCTEWYLLTTYYYPDGSTSITEEYLGTTCNNCPPNSVCEMQDDAFSNGNATQHVSQVDWIVGSANWWYVKSYTRLKGTKSPGTPGGGFFTEVEHLNSEIFNLQGVASWKQLAVTTNADGWIATSSIAGKISAPDIPDFQISKTKTWSFSQIFP